MDILINGQHITIDTALSLPDLLAQQGFQGSFALAINGDFVPKSEYASTPLNEGDALDVLTPISGG
ncbi:MAG: sulfur carrier protein ThiS [Oceanospirillaceae bacterium]|nr:sulfur carrier protein ThiS [Oceanospirillaceae bacterium]MCP5349540.1 sulfur carrier protein ThiS [Oceanospirillaceae bacterium]